MNWTRSELAAHERKDKPVKPNPQDRFRSKWEREYATRLTSGGERWMYEAIKLRLAGNTFYTPDFFLPRSLKFVEVKGFWRDDARVKIKVAAEMFPMFEFIAVTKDRRSGEWTEEQIGRTRAL